VRYDRGTDIPQSIWRLSCGGPNGEFAVTIPVCASKRPSCAAKSKASETETSPQMSYDRKPIETQNITGYTSRSRALWSALQEKLTNGNQLRSQQMDGRKSLTITQSGT